MSNNIPLAKELLWRPLSKLRFNVATSVLALVMISLSHGSLVILVGPLLTAMLGADGEWVNLTSLLPPHLLQFWDLQDFQVKVSWLKIAIPTSMLGVGFLKSVSSYLYQVNQKFISISIAAHYREMLFKSILKQDFEHICQRTTGQWMSTIMNDVHFLQARFSDLGGGLLRDGVIVISAICALALIHWPSTVLLLLVAPVAGLIMGRIGRKISHYSEGWQRELGHLSGHVFSIRQRFEFMRAQNGERFEIDEFEKTNRAYYKHIRKSLLIRSAFAPWLEFLGIVTFVLAIMAIAKGFWFDDLGASALFQLFAAIGILLRPLKNIGEQLSRYQETIGALRDSLKVLRTTYAQQDDLPPGTPTAISRFELRRLEAGYFSKPTVVLENIQLVPGKCVAIIGPSGAGKSTIIKTFAGLLRPILWDANIGCDEVGLDSSFVSQNPFLFDGDLRSNLNYHQNPPIEDDVLWEALEDISIAQELKKNGRGLENRISALNPDFSGGQIQRIVIARALLRERSFWLFDEATSAVDEASEAEITSRIISLARERGKILLAVTHRLKWLELFDEVWFVEHGRLIYSGKHSDLMGKTRYRQFVNKSSE